MRQTVLGGAVLAVAAALLVLFGDDLGLDVQQVALLGAALGASLGLVPDRGPLERVGGFAVGVAAAWIGYGLRAGYLPDAQSGRAVAVLLVLGACIAVAALTAGRIPLWSTLLGIAAVVGAYEEQYTAAPSRFLEQSVSAVTAVLLAAAIGFLATSILGPAIEERRARERRAEPRGGGSHSRTTEPEETDVPLDDILDQRQEHTR